MSNIRDMFRNISKHKRKGILKILCQGLIGQFPAIPDVYRNTDRRKQDAFEALRQKLYKDLVRFGKEAEERDARNKKWFDYAMLN